jgi:hypothetical protein
MKTIASIAIATLTLSAVPEIQAHDYSWKNKKITIHNCAPIPHYKPHFCAPTLVCTKEISRCYHSRVGYDSHGCLIKYNVLLITYANYYSDGSSRTYTRTYYV